MELRPETGSRSFIGQRVSVDTLGSCQIPTSNRRSKLLEADRESVRVFSSTSSVPFGPYGRDHSPEHGQTSLSTVLALRHSTRTHDILTSRKTRRRTDQGGRGYCSEEKGSRWTMARGRFLLEHETNPVEQIESVG